MRSFRLRVAAGFLVSLTVAGQNRAPDKADREQAERQEWFYEQRRFPLGHIPTGARIVAIDEIKRTTKQATAPASRLAQPHTVTTDALNWTLIGPQPTDLGTGYATAGRVNAIAVDPRNNKVVYIGAAEGGVWKTTDGGLTWIPLTDNQPTLANGAIVLDPKNPDIVYVGTGEENFTQDSYYGAGILKSTDAGVTWTNLVGPFLRAKIGSLAISPQNSQVLLCTTGKGVWRSADGAATWKQVLGASAASIPGTSVVFDPTDGSIAYAALAYLYGDTRNGVFRSSDGGLTWQPALGSGAAVLPNKNVGRITLAVAPSAASTIYAAIQNASEANFGEVLGLWKSIDSGVTWNQLSNFPANFCAKQCWYDMALAVDPQNPDVVFAGGLGLVRSLNGGATWAHLPFTGSTGSYIHVDQHFLTFTPDGTTLYIANDGGVYSTTDIANPGVNWVGLNDTLAITQFYPGMSVDPTHVDTALGGTQDNGTQLYEGLPSWSSVTCGDGGYTAIDPAATGVFYAACHDIEIQRTAPNGDFIPTVYGIDPTDRSDFIPPMVLDAASPSVLYFGTYRIWRTADGAGRWRAVSPDITADSSDRIKTIAVAPADSNVVYAGTAHGNIHMTSDAAHGSTSTWLDRTNGLPLRTITRLVVDPVESMTAYVTFSGFAIGSDVQGHVFRTRNAGRDWTDISTNLPNIPVNDLVVDADIPGTLYAGTDAGVMFTKDSGVTWTSLGAGLPLVVVPSLTLQRQARVLRAATHGRSVWEIAVPLPAPSLQPTITSLIPNHANASAGVQTIQVKGSNFSSDTVLRWNGQILPATVVDATDLTVQVPGRQIAVIGQAAVQAFTPIPGGGASNPVYFAVGPAPEAAVEAFVNAANPLGGSVLAPGTIASLYGANFASQTIRADAAPPLPFTLGGVTLTLDTIPVPLSFVSPTQINFQVPFFHVVHQTSLMLTITQGSFNTSFPVTIRAYAPALFTTNSQGSGQAASLIAGTSSIPAPAGRFDGSRPARPGEDVSFYCTGLGSVTNPPLNGYPSPPDPNFARTGILPTFTIGGAPATVSFSGLAPGFVGLYQVNVQVPAGLAPGSAVPVVLTIGGVSSNTATIAIE